MAAGLYLLLAIWLRGISDDIHLGDVKTGFCQIQDVVMLQAVLGSSEALDPSDCASGPVCRTKPNSESDASAKKKKNAPAPVAKPAVTSNVTWASSALKRLRTPQATTAWHISTIAW